MLNFYFLIFPLNFIPLRVAFNLIKLLFTESKIPPGLFAFLLS